MLLTVPWRAVGIAATLGCTVGVAHPQVGKLSPSLPALSVETLPAAVRAPLAGAYEAVRARPDDEEATGHLAMLLHAYQQFGMAAAYYERANRLDPGDSRWTYLLGIVRAEVGATDEAIACFDRTLVLDGGNLAARLRLADALLSGGDTARSKAEYEAIVRSYPELALAHYGLGRVAAAAGDKSAAASSYQRAVDLSPAFGPAHYALALILRDGGNVEAASRHLDAYRKFDKRRPVMVDPLLDGVRAMVGTARELIAAAKRAADAGRFEDAVALHLRALEADPTAAQAHVNLIALYGRTGRVAEAESHYQAAIRLAGHTADAHYNYGVLMAAGKRAAEAQQAFGRALEADPFHPRAHNNLGALLAMQGRQEAAMEHYRQALASDPQHAAARFGLGRLLVAAGRPDEAIPHLERLASAATTEKARYTYALANAHLAAGRTAQAIDLAQRALDDARRLGQVELAHSIEQHLTRMKEGRQ
jgi:tetratricopeptide (TPR) repeat protein